MNRRSFLSTPRGEAALRISRNYWVDAEFVADLLEFFDDSEERVRRVLDMYSPLGVIPSAETLRQVFGVRMVPNEPT